MRKGVDCKSREWEEVEISGYMTDITGKRSGRLVALFPVIYNETKQWLCQCDCGNTTIVYSHKITGRKVESCGCLQRELMSEKWENFREENNVIGQKFGRLTAVEFIGVENQSAIYRFNCDCGNTVELPIRVVKCGNTQSCGCLRLDWEKNCETEIIGEKFGRLLVVSYAGIDSYGGRQYNCLCDCGEQTVVSKSVLITGRTQSCGCLRSVGENNIRQILIDNAILYKQQHVFSDLTSEAGKLLPYDFAIFNEDGCVARLIEFDGPQHVKPYDYFGGEEKFLKVQTNDLLKNQYALSHNIPLVRIPYNKRDSMILEDLFGLTYLVN